jgi:hypothetical protein
MGEHKFGTKYLSEGISFIGKIVNAYWTQSKDFGMGARETLVLEVKPLSIETENNRFIYIPYSDRLNSKWGKFNELLENSGLQFDPETFTEDDLINKTFEFKTFDLKFGSGENAIQAPNVLLPVRYIPETEQRNVEEQQPKETAPPQTQKTPPQTPGEEITPKELILSYIKLKGTVTFKELTNFKDSTGKILISRDGLVMLLLELSEERKIEFDGSVIKYIGSG